MDKGWEGGGRFEEGMEKEKDGNWGGNRSGLGCHENGELGHLCVSFSLGTWLQNRKEGGTKKAPSDWP